MLELESKCSVFTEIIIKMLHLSLCEAAALPSNVEWGLERLKRDFEVKVISSNIFN